MTQQKTQATKRKILFQLTGSIACFKACVALSKLVQSGHEVRTVASANALRFVGAATLEGLTGTPPFTDVFESGAAMDHIALARWADVMIVAPATANILNKMAAGIADDVIGALYLANNFRCPYFVAPAMNVEMWNHPATRRALRTLKQDGVRVIGPAEGTLACGEQGAGRMVEPETIVEALCEF